MIYALPQDYQLMRRRHNHASVQPVTLGADKPPSELPLLLGNGRKLALTLLALHIVTPAEGESLLLAELRSTPRKSPHVSVFASSAHGTRMGNANKSARGRLVQDS